jgi:hypothetical protein
MAEFKLCENMDCERYPPDWDFEEDTEDTYQEGQWKKCCLCAGYFDDDGLGDILFVQEEPNNQEDVACQLCGKDKNIVQMKGTGEYICEAACDEEEEEEDDFGIGNEGVEALIKEDESRLYLFKRLEEENYNYNNDEDNENLKGVEKEKINNCDVCCKDKSFETYYRFKRGRKQELFSCVKCWENRKTQLVGDTWTWEQCTFPGPAFYTVNVKEEEQDK